MKRLRIMKTKKMKNMKKIIFLAIFAFGLSTTIDAQVFKAGVKVGLSTPNIRPSDVKAFNTDSLNVKLSDAFYGFHFGGWARLSVGRFVIQPEILYNSAKVQYTAKSIKAGFNLTDTIRNEKFTNLDIPVLVGMKFGGFRLNAGPVAHIHLDSNSDLTKFSSYTGKFKTATWGYQAGIGAEFGRLGIDIRYEGNFTKFGEHINFGSKSYTFDKSPSRFLVSAAIGF
jgi:hypothetical protein